MQLLIERAIKGELSPDQRTVFYEDPLRFVLENQVLETFDLRRVNG